MESIEKLRKYADGFVTVQTHDDLMGLIDEIEAEISERYMLLPELRREGGGRMSELKPCPFCGGEAQTHSNGKEIVCLLCECLGPFCDTEAEAIEAWNTRTELYRRTCSITDTTVVWNDDVHTTVLCSECGEEYTVDFKYLNYCPNCGAKVISE